MKGLKNTMSSKVVSLVGLANKNDECYTPRYAIEPLLKYIKPNSTIWCPFDKGYSNFVKVLTEAEHKVIHSHIDDGQNFFSYEPNEEYDYIVSNPPFSRKREVLQRLRKLNKPYMILLPLNLLNDNYNDVLDDSLELLIFDKRIEFLSQGKVGGNAKDRISFKSVYFCKGMLGGKNRFEKLYKQEEHFPSEAVGDIVSKIEKKLF